MGAELREGEGREGETGREAGGDLKRRRAESGCVAMGLCSTLTLLFFDYTGQEAAAAARL